MVADNDLALGMVVEAVSQSKFWKETAIFVIEDDAQNGPDHVDAHRVRGAGHLAVHEAQVRGHTLYSTTSMLRTMELILGLKPMSQFDAAARPMFNSLHRQAGPDGVQARNAEGRSATRRTSPAAFGAAWMEKQNLAKEDTLDDLLFNEIIWKAVKGTASACPPPVRAAFFVPVKPKREKDDDDD